MVGDAKAFKKLIQLLIFATPICLHSNDFTIDLLSSVVNNLVSFSYKSVPTFMHGVIRGFDCVISLFVSSMREPQI